MDLGLKDRVAVVTGASYGLGEAMAQRLVKEGAHVVICARGEEQLTRTAQAIRSAGPGRPRLMSVKPQASRPFLTQRYSSSASLISWSIMLAGTI